MKLIYCDTCQDLFKLDYDIRTCKCGRCKGKYNVDGRNAITNGEGFCLAIDNFSLINSLKNLLHYEGEYNFKAWVRPHIGEYNSNTRIIKEL
uniref:Uncharacterized protein n=1 Tax=viral metagenome TaxID=1070528 RepID=A0A6M3LIT8_9ZZZZ